jgi:hypothetical protein
MPKEDSSVLVNSATIIKAIRKANKPALVEKVKAPSELEGLESVDGGAASVPPATDAEAAQMLEELNRAAAILEAEGKKDGVLVAPDDEMTSRLQSLLAEESIAFNRVETDADGGLEAQFDEHDLLRWAGSLLTWIRGLKKHDWQTAPASPDLLPNTFAAAVLGDWGTGLYGAPVCATTIQNDAKDYGLLLHLGDVYYSGTEKEVNDRFLNLWPKKANAISRACNANHEMYTGGYAYFDLILKAFTQPASYFALQNDHWLLVGLDTAYHEWDLYGDQVAWLTNLMNQAGDRRVTLFTHHQPFSWADTVKGPMPDQLADLLNSKKIFAWYWGHEHRCVVYDQHPQWGLFGRCVGHGGYPYFTDKFTAGTVTPVPNAQGVSWRRVPANEKSPGAVILQGPNPYVPGHTADYGPNGYVSLEFDGEHLTEIYQTPDGGVARRQVLI